MCGQRYAGLKHRALNFPFHCMYTWTSRIIEYEVQNVFCCNISMRFKENLTRFHTRRCARREYIISMHGVGFPISKLFQIVPVLPSWQLVFYNPFDPNNFFRRSRYGMNIIFFEWQRLFTTFDLFFNILSHPFILGKLALQSFDLFQAVLLINPRTGSGYKLEHFILDFRQI